MVCVEEAWMVQALGTGIFGTGWMSGSPRPVVTAVSLSKLSSEPCWSRMDLNCAQVQVPAHAWVSPGHGSNWSTRLSGTSQLFSSRTTSSCFEGFPESYNAFFPWDLQGNPSSDPHPLTNASRIWARGQGGASH